METIVLDFSDQKVKIVTHPPLNQDDLESLLFSKEGYDFSPNNTQWMETPILQIEYFPRKPIEINYCITEDEIKDFTGEKLSDEQVFKILSYIENDEGIWEAIEVAKRDAISFVIR